MLPTRTPHYLIFIHWSAWLRSYLGCDFMGKFLVTLCVKRKLNFLACRFLYDPEDRQRPAEEFVLGDRASGGIQEFPMHLTMLRQTQAFGWRVPLPAAGEVLVSIKDGDAYVQPDCPIYVQIVDLVSISQVRVPVNVP